MQRVGYNVQIAETTLSTNLIAEQQVGVSQGLRFSVTARIMSRRQRSWKNLWQVRRRSTVADVMALQVSKTIEDFEAAVEPMLLVCSRSPISAHGQIRRVYIPKPGKQEKRPLGVPCVQRSGPSSRSVAEVLVAHLRARTSCQLLWWPAWAGRPQCRGCGHDAISGCTKNTYRRMDATSKNFFGSLDDGWLLRFVEHRVGDPRIISLIRRWLKAGVFEDGELHSNEEGTPQGGSISVLLSNLYLHYVLDLWFDRMVRPRLKGEAYLVRYIDDFVVCFQYRDDALRFQNVLRKRLGKFGLVPEPTKTKLVEFGRYAQRDVVRRGRKRPETIYFLGMTLYCTRNRKGNFRVGLRTEKSRLRRSLAHLRGVMRRMRHLPVREQVHNLNRVLRGHYAYYGIAGNLRALQHVARAVERYWRQMLSSRSRAGFVRWEVFNRIQLHFPLQRPKLALRYREFQSLAVL